MSHMVADTVEELHQMADRLNLSRQHFQMSRSGIPHYDVCSSKRKQAILNGAVEVSRREMAQHIKQKRGDNLLC